MVKNSNAPRCHWNARHLDRVMYTDATEPAVPSPLALLCRTELCSEGLHKAALPSSCQWSIGMPSSLQSFLVPRETQQPEIPSSINWLGFTPAGLKGHKIAICPVVYTKVGFFVCFFFSGSLQKRGLVIDPYLCPLCSSS